MATRITDIEKITKTINGLQNQLEKQKKEFQNLKESQKEENLQSQKALANSIHRLTLLKEDPKNQDVAKRLTALEQTARENINAKPASPKILGVQQQTSDRSDNNDKIKANLQALKDNIKNPTPLTKTMSSSMESMKKLKNTPVTNLNKLKGDLQNLEDIKKAMGNNNKYEKLLQELNNNQKRNPSKNFPSTLVEELAQHYTQEKQSGKKSLSHTASEIVSAVESASKTPTPTK